MGSSIACPFTRRPSGCPMSTERINSPSTVGRIKTLINKTTTREAGVHHDASPPALHHDLEDCQHNLWVPRHSSADGQGSKAASSVAGSTISLALRSPESKPKGGLSDGSFQDEAGGCLHGYQGPGFSHN